MSEWIPADNPPAKSFAGLVTVEAGVKHLRRWVMWACYLPFDKTWHSGGGIQLNVNRKPRVTHWMPPPAPAPLDETQ